MDRNSWKCDGGVLGVPGFTKDSREGEEGVDGGEKLAGGGGLASSMTTC